MKASELLLLGGAFLLITHLSKNGNGKSITEKRSAIIAQEPDLTSIFNQMTDQEVSDVYELFFTYYGQGVNVPPGSLRDRLLAISNKYNIFT